MKNKISNCYDSHTHFWATGLVESGLKLNQLRHAEDINTIEIKKNYFRDKWITGFGWDQNNWSDKKFPHKKILDKAFPSTPVFLSRTDGHASWINTEAIRELKKNGYNFENDPHGGIIDRDENGELTGLLFDQAHINALMKLPDFNDNQHHEFFQTSQKIFNKSGFTHIRDLSMNLKYWNILRKMEDAKALTVCLDAFITVESLVDLDLTLQTIKQIKEDQSGQLRLHGVKIFIDGSLGSKTAFLSESYLTSNNKGILIWSKEDIKILLKKVWQMNYQVAIHTIGDQAADIAVQAAREISAEGVLGRLHLEHVQILRHETIQLMKPLHITCHLQPCHWLSDHSWLKETISENLVKNLFQWELLRKNKIPFFFGSDSPIEKPSLFNNVKALKESEKQGIPKLNSDWKLYHTHPDSNWMNSTTEFSNDEITQVYFNGTALF